MSGVPENVILIWTGTNASIPSGWQRETTLDGKYPKAWGGENPGDTGGSNTHTHTSTGHTHTMIGHSHSVSLTHYQGPASYSNRNDQVADNHGHNAASIGNTSGGTLQSNAVTWASGNSEPPYHEVIFIKPTAGGSLIADDVCTYWYEVDPPTGFTHCDGTGGTPDLRGKYLKGASASGDAGGTGGATSHTHSITHTHTASGHTHSGTSGYFDSGNRGNADALSGAHRDHRHTINLSSASPAANNYTNASAGGSDTGIEPAHKKVAVIQNTSGTTQGLTPGLIGLWLQTVGTVPGGWKVCDGTDDTPDLRDQFIKVITTTGDIGSTGGSNTHSHTTVTGHTHTSTSSHTHGGSVNSTGYSRNADTGGDGGSPLGHGHSINTPSSVSATYNTADIDSNSGNAEPAYVIAAYIMQSTSVENSYAKANIVRFNEEQTNMVKAKVCAVEENYAKAYIPTFKQSQSAKATIYETPYRKTYDYRVYDGANYVTTWSEDVISEPTYRAVVNGGPGEMIVKLARTFDDFGEEADVKLFNTVEVWCFDKEAKSGVLIYSGFISGYRPIIDGHTEYVEVTLLHQIARMSQIMLRDGAGDTSLAMNSTDPSQMFRDIIDYYRADKGIIDYTGASVINTNTMASYTFNLYTIKEALDKVVELAPENWFWRVDSDNTAVMSNYNIARANHVVQIGKNVSHLETWRRAEDMINRVYFVGQEDGGGVPRYYVYSNDSSVNTYGIHATKYIDQRVSLTSTANLMAGIVLNRKSDPEVRTVLTITDSNGHESEKGYDIESIKPGQSIQVRNLKQPEKTVTRWDQGQWDVDVWDQTLAYQAASILQIVAIEYTPTHITIEASSKTPEVSKRMEEIYRNWENSATWNVPATPS